MKGPNLACGVLENDAIRIEISKEAEEYKLGPIWLKTDQELRFCADHIEFLIKKKKISITDCKSSETIDGDRRLVLSNGRLGIIIQLELSTNQPKKFIEIVVFSNYKLIKSFKIKLKINFDRINNLDYVALSGNLYRYIGANEIIKKKANTIGSFSGIWTASSKGTTIGFISIKQSRLRFFEFLRNKKDTTLLLHTRIEKNKKIRTVLFLGEADYTEPIKVKFKNLEPIDPIPFYIDGETEARKAFFALKHFFSIPINSGLIPSNFVYYPIKKKDKMEKSVWSSYGNCFSLGAIYGMNALYLWTQEVIAKNYLIELIAPLIRNAQIKEGDCTGAFFDTYSHRTNKWTTGRVQFKEGGFSDWLPFQSKNSKDRKGMSFKETMKLGRRDFLLHKLEFIPHMILEAKLSKMAIPYMKLTIDKPVIYPPFAGQFAFFLLQTLIESKDNRHFLGKKFEEEIESALNLTVNFLLDKQKPSEIWDHELYIDGNIFWDIQTLACIFPATFLIWWGKEYNDEECIKQGLKAIEKVNTLHDRNEYYGMYFETNLSIHQYDLVTAVTCIKCYVKLYKLLNTEDFLIRARRAAWHVISSMWSGIFDRKGKNITGGLLVTTHKGMGFPVVGGSELCQTFETFCELAEIDNTFLVYAQAMLGYCLTYLIRKGNKSLGIYEIMFGYADNWSSSYSVDFASYASGPFMRGLWILKTKLE